MQVAIDYAELVKEAGEPLVKKRLSFEQVYFGAEMVHKYFGDVTEIYQDVLDVFQNLDPKPKLGIEDKGDSQITASAQEIRNLALSLENVQYGRVDNRNCTSAIWRKTVERQRVSFDNWINEKLVSEKYVKVEFKRSDR